MKHLLRLPWKQLVQAGANRSGWNMAQVDMLPVDELVREIGLALVDEPSAVIVESVVREESTLLKL